MKYWEQLLGEAVHIEEHGLHMSDATVAEYFRQAGEHLRQLERGHNEQIALHIQRQKQLEAQIVELNAQLQDR